MGRLLDPLGASLYLAILLAAVALDAVSRLLRLPRAVLPLALGLGLGRTGFEVVSADSLLPLLTGVHLHLGLLLGVLGHRLGLGMLRLPWTVVVRRSLPPLLLAGAALAIGSALLPLLIPEAPANRSFYRFALPLACIFAVFPLLAIRDLKGPPPPDVGSIFLVAILLVGVVTSSAPALLWGKADPSILWRGPVLILGESGALGVGLAVLYLFLVRSQRWPRWPVAAVLLAALSYVSFALDLWLPFAALGFGIALGRTDDPGPRLRVGSSALFSETPFLLLAATAFAPDLFLESLLGPALLHALALVAVLVLVWWRVPGGRALVTGPGLLFLGLTLGVRLDRRMGPITRYAVDFALPAWVLLRIVAALLRSRARTRE